MRKHYRKKNDFNKYVEKSMLNYAENVKVKRKIYRNTRYLGSCRYSWEIGFGEQAAYASVCWKFTMKWTT